ncbi:hypothetical protein M0638_15600 [Roseomonas sp. NAR14]|uniref:Uncharacterized protein n=1 Tax=Roseomonas acroporae TaxID=2937791 RepID=A0A9X2BXC5_9PROT|nr:hypothetical protein [Roseomonas acroporae]MCK8785804.1 hypothetical protein [Roseomonas acroporae]
MSHRPSWPRNRLPRILGALLLAGTGFAGGCVVAQTPFPNIVDAQNHLQAALASLERAPDRFGGHKGEAQRLIRAALGELEEAKRAFR